MQTRNAQRKRGWIYAASLLSEKDFLEEVQAHGMNMSCSSGALLPALC